MESAKLDQNSIPAKPLTPEFPLKLGFEENFDIESGFEFLVTNAHLPLIFGFGVYLPVLYFGQKIMANREPIKLRGPLIIWNLGLALFSLMGFARTSHEIVHLIKNFGFQHTVCNNSYMTSKQVSLWMYLFAVSKLFELVDTLFLVLRKQKLIFLHVYHHSTVTTYAWYTAAAQMAALRWFCSVNYGIHTVMYTYFALKAMPELIRIPKWFSMMITSAQTIQMVFGLYVLLRSTSTYLSGGQCDTTIPIAVFGFVIYGSYLVLFSHFFYKAYLSPTPLKPAKDDKKRA